MMSRSWTSSGKRQLNAAHRSSFVSIATLDTRLGVKSRESSVCLRVLDQGQILGGHKECPIVVKMSFNKSDSITWERTRPSSYGVFGWRNAVGSVAWVQDPVDKADAHRKGGTYLGDS
jgi:hypothetical protein